ncbi:ATPase, T2SS/T4P/T4SS family [Streptomyces cyaneofuscatus]|uniref:ATPase, T2SS/T4P/T4SS family n=1 Tax=Streptomyces cyaneofuscatus TaxID=66883 RepID=UPI0037FCA67F|nr:type IV pilus twitching motility protein PilT [Streptomyces cyaneofuscatus]
MLVTGPTGSRKSTSLAAVLDHVNTHQSTHLLTIEDPIEYLHRHKRSAVSQLDFGTDTDSFPAALRSALRRDPDVLLLGKMHDPESISAALTIAETGTPGVRHPAHQTTRRRRWTTSSTCSRPSNSQRSECGWRTTWSTSSTRRSSPGSAGSGWPPSRCWSARRRSTT